VIVIETISKTEQQLFPEIEALRTKLDATDRRLQEANEILQVQIAERKRGEEAFEKAQKYAESVGETIREPLWVLTAGLKVITANRSFYETFQVAPKETEGRFIFDVGNHPWDIPALREPLQEIIPQNTHFSNFEVDHAFPRIGRKRVLLNARRIYREGKGADRILLALEDITDQKRTEEAGDKRTRLDCPPSFKVSLNILRFHHILRPNKSFYASFLFSPVDLIPCY
jgi:PAS domain S-box-containing protein